MAKSGQMAADALRWSASGGKPPKSIAKLSTKDQAALAQAAGQVKNAIKKK